MKASKRKELMLVHLDKFLAERVELTGLTLRGKALVLTEAKYNFKNSCKLAEHLQEAILKLIVRWGKQYYSKPTNSSAYRKWIKNLKHRPNQN